MNSLLDKASLYQTKLHNTRLVLLTIFEKGPISRAKIAKSTGLSKPTISLVVQELIKSGFVKSIGKGRSKKGKNPILLSMDNGSYQIIGLDLGNTQFKGALFDLFGNIIYQYSIDLCFISNEENGLNEVFCLLEKISSKVTKPLLGIGIGTPGIIDDKNGIVVKAVNLNWENMPIKQILQKKYQVPVFVSNDCKVAALAEFNHLDLFENKNLLLLKVGRGVGSGIIIDRKLHHGEGFGAGEIGHLSLNDNGDKCSCGKKGCLETLVSTTSIVNKLKNSIEYSNGKKFDDREDLTFDEYFSLIVNAFYEGNPNVVEVVNEVALNIGYILAIFMNVLNIDLNVIAGEIQKFGPSILPYINKGLKTRSFSILNKNLSVRFSEFADDIVLRGASSLVLFNELDMN